MSEFNFHSRYSKFAAALINDYDGEEPFHLYLKKYFKAHKKHGSRDRREISALCYHYFRLGKGVLKDLSVEERVDLAHVIIPGEVSTLDKRIEDQSQIFDALEIFPFNEQLSAEIETGAFNKSFLIQPMAFIRIRPGFEAAVIRTLENRNIPHTRFSDDAVGFESNLVVANLFRLNKEVLIQDINSQNVSKFFEHIGNSHTENIKIWDACAGSGGKSILAKDYFPHARLTVSDVRKSILSNLHQRFRQSGLKDYDWFIADLTTHTRAREKYDLIIVDAPCSGSGTWSRTPEQLLYFDGARIAEYAHKQKEIVRNCMPALKENGYLLYITCSVFAKENEEMTDHFLSEHPVKLMHQQYLKGYSDRADTLYGALFQSVE